MSTLVKRVPLRILSQVNGTFRLKPTNALLALLVLPIAGVSVWGLTRVDELEQRQIGSALQTVLFTTQTGLHVWARETKEEAASWANSEPLRAAVQEQLKLSRDPELLRNSEAFSRILRVLEPMHLRRGYQGYVVVAPDGTQVAASLDRDVGAKHLLRRDPATLSQALSGRVALGLPFPSAIPLPVENGEWYPTYPTMVLAAPITDEDGLVIAALAFRMDPSADFTRVARLARLGNSGNTYAFDAKARVLTESRFDQRLRQIGLVAPGQRSILSLELRDPGGNMLQGFRPVGSREQLALTRMAKSALVGESGMDMDGYRDYRGVPVLGAWLWDNELHLGLATEIDKAEAYQPLRVARGTVLFMLAVMVLGAAMAAGILASRARTLAVTVSREQAALSARDEVLQIISHDLKNPLGVISLSSGLILKDEDRSVHDPLSIRKHIRTIERAAERMSELIDDLLQTSLIEAGRLRLDRRIADPADLLERAFELQEPLATQKSIQLKKELSGRLPPVRADEKRILRVFSNLIGNAIKFTPEGGAIALRAERTEEDEVWFTVQDSGPGIPAEDLPHVFDRYWQAQRTAALGTGLGLFIARGIVEAHGGKMWVVSTSGDGTAFHFTLPST